MMYTWKISAAIRNTCIVDSMRRTLPFRLTLAHPEHNFLTADLTFMPRNCVDEPKTGVEDVNKERNGVDRDERLDTARKRDFIRDIVS